MTEIWKYKTTKVSIIGDTTVELDEHMNAIAEEGWENYFASFDEYGKISRLFWKRPKE